MSDYNWNDFFEDYQDFVSWGSFTVNDNVSDDDLSDYDIDEDLPF